MLDLYPDAHKYLHLSIFPSITTFLDKTGNTTPFKYVRPLEDKPGCVLALSIDFPSFTYLCNA
jgi:hypothetical protein